MNKYESAKRIAKIMGESSAAHKAVKEYDKLKEAGLNPVLTKYGTAWVVFDRGEAK